MADTYLRNLFWMRNISLEIFIVNRPQLSDSLPILYCHPFRVERQ